MPRADLAQLRQAVDGIGFAVAPQSIEPSLTRAVLADVTEIWTEHRDRSTHTRDRVRPQLQHLHLRSAAVASLTRHPLFAAIGEATIGPDVDHVFNQAFVKGPGGHDVARVPWHQDAAFAELDQRGINCWLALTAANTENGALEVAPARALLPHTWNDALAFPETATSFPDAQTIVLDAGQVVVFTQHVPHRSGRNLGEHERIGISLGFCAPGARLRDGTEVFGARVPVVRDGRSTTELLLEAAFAPPSDTARSLLAELRAAGRDPDRDLRILNEQPARANEVLNRLLSVGEVDEDPDVGNVFRD